MWSKVGGNMFMGEYQHSLDEKNRLIIPSKFREMLTEEFIITKGIENCLYIYPMKEWNKLVGKLNELSFTKKDVRTFMRSFFSGANNVSLDKQGRVPLSKNHILHANITKECVIIGVCERIEIWSKESWEEFLSINQDKLEEISENLFEREN